MTETDTAGETPETAQEPLSEPEAPDTGDVQGDEGEGDSAAPDEVVEATEPQAVGEREWEKRFRDAEKAFAAYKRKVEGIYGDDAEYLLPLSISPSAPPGFLYAHDAGRVPEEMVTPVMEFFGLAREQDYAPDPETRTCETCDGKGKTRTGSSVPGNETRQCRPCRGYGYVPPPGQPENGSVAASDFHAPAGEREAPLVEAEVDMWGEPRILPDGRENPNFGRLPQHKVNVPPFGVTRGLTAQDAPAGV